MTTGIASQLPPCPLPDCGGGEHHYHDINVYRVHEGHDCTREASPYRCYGPHRPGLSEPIDLPEITDEMVESALHSFAGGIRAALLASIPHWEPIEPDQIRAGMRIRATGHRDDLTTIHVGVAHRLNGSGYWYTAERRALAGWSYPTTYEVDPAAIPDPDAELIELIGKAIYDADESADESADEWGEDGTEDACRKLARAVVTVIRESEVEA